MVYSPRVEKTWFPSHGVIIIQLLNLSSLTPFPHCNLNVKSVGLTPSSFYKDYAFVFFCVAFLVDVLRGNREVVYASGRGAAQSFQNRVPLPASPLKYLNSYVIRSPDRNLVIDT
jgi:hypothetical protein